MKNSSRGYTLLEMLVSIGAVAIVGALIAQVFFTTTRTNTKTELLKDVKQNGEYAIDTMGRMIRNSLGIVSSCSAAGTTLTSLEIKNADGFDTVFECKPDAVNALTLTRIASTSALTSSSENITSNNVTLGGADCSDAATTLKFICVSYADQPPKVTIQFRLSQRGTPQDQFEKASVFFQTSISPRN